MRNCLVRITLCTVIALALTCGVQGQVLRGASSKPVGTWQAKPNQNGLYQTVGYMEEANEMEAPILESEAYAPSMQGYSSQGYSSCGVGGGCGACTSCGPMTDYNACGPCGDYGNACGVVDMGCGVTPCWGNNWFVTGWIDQGVTINPYWPDNRFNGVLRYTDRANDYQMNQLYLAMGKSVDPNSCRWDIGARVDLLYGTDYFFTSALGLETRTDSNYGYPVTDPTAASLRWNSNEGPRRAGDAALYGLAMPQLYAEVQAPIGLNFKAGHFYSPMGHESVMATQNFFYSHSYAMMYGEPTTLTGMLLSQRITPCLTGYFGIHRGWDKWESPADKISYLAGAKWENCAQTTSLGFLISTGVDQLETTDSGGKTRTGYSLVFSQAITPVLHFVFQHDLGHEENGSYEIVDGKVVYRDGDWLSFSPYLYLQLTPSLSFGCRYEWFRDQNHSRVLKPGPVMTTMGGVVTQEIMGDEYQELTLGFNWKPNPWFCLRPEVRWDWSDVYGVDNTYGTGFNGLFSDYTKKTQFTIGVDLVVTF